MRISDWSSDVCASDLVDELLLYMAPVLLGGDARPLFAGLGIEQMAQRLQLQLVETLPVGDDLRLLLRPNAAQTNPTPSERTGARGPCPGRRRHRRKTQSPRPPTPPMPPPPPRLPPE